MYILEVCLLAVVAMSGGTGSALVAYLVASVFEENTVACIAKSGSVPPEKLERARYIADLVGEWTSILGTAARSRETSWLLDW